MAGAVVGRVEAGEVDEMDEAVGEAVEVGTNEGGAEREHLTLGIVKTIGFKHTCGFETKRILFAVGFLILKWRCFTFKEHFLFGSLEQS